MMQGADGPPPPCGEGSGVGVVRSEIEPTSPLPTAARSAFEPKGL
jgi:hypothetical protein